ncbi:MAG: carbohydrate porin, partial [Stellaceae bacterium]
TLHEPLPGRANDTFGVGMGYTHVSGRVAGYDRDDAAFNPGTFWPTQSGETFIEITYQAQVTPWLQLQPDFQYFFNPGGGIANPNQPNRKVEDEAILCVRANITF